MTSETRVLNRLRIIEIIQDGIDGSLSDADIADIYRAVYMQDDCKANGDGTFTVIMRDPVP